MSDAPPAPVVDDVSLATYAEVVARLDVLSARAPLGDGGPAARRAALVREAGWDEGRWARVDRGFRDLLGREAADGAMRAGAIADRFPLLVRYGALYAAAKKAALAEAAPRTEPPPPVVDEPVAPPSGAPASAVDASNQAVAKG